MGDENKSVVDLIIVVTGSFKDCNGKMISK